MYTCDHHDDCLKPQHRQLVCLIKIDLPNPELQKNAAPKTSTMNARICSYSSDCHLKCLEKKPLKLSLYTASLEYFHAEKSSSLKMSVMAQRLSIA